MMPGCWQKGKGELVHGQGQPIKCARQRVGQVFLTRGDVHVFCVGQHERRQEVATHLANKEAQNLNVPKKGQKNLLSFAATHDAGEELEVSQFFSIRELPQDLGT